MNNISLKIYGVTTVGQKGQIIIPKECREDFLVNSGSEFELAMIDKTAFGLGSKCRLKKEGNIKLIEKFGNVCIGTKFQFVIPVVIRKELGIESGDNLVVIGKCGNGLGFMKNDKIDYLTKYIKDMTI